MLVCDVHARHGTARHGTARHGTARHGTARHGTARHSTARHSTAQHGTAQHGTARHGTAQHSTAQHCSGARNVEQTSGRSCTHAASSCIEAFHGGKHVGNEAGTIIQSCTYCVPCRTVNAGTAVLTRSFCFYLIPSRVYINGNAPWD